LLIIKVCNENLKTWPLIENDHPQASNNDILEAILELVKRVTGIESQLGDIKEQNRQNTAMIASLTKTVQINSEELNEVKKKMLKLERANCLLVEENRTEEESDGTETI